MINKKGKVIIVRLLLMKSCRLFIFASILFLPMSVSAEYTSYHESRTGEVACGGEYTSYHESRTGKVCAGGERK